MKRMAGRRLLAVGMASAVVLVSVVALAVAALVLLWHLNANDYREDVANEIERSAGLIVSIDGTVTFALTPLPTVIATEVRVANPPWTQRTEMAQIDRVEVTLSPLDLLTHRKRLPRLALFGAQIHLERDRDGRANWWRTPDTGASATPTPQQPTEIGRLELNGSRIELVDRGTGREARLGVRRATIRLPRDGPFRLDLLGDWFGTPFNATLTGGRYADLINDQSGWAAKGELQNTDTTVDFRGTVDQPMTRRGYDLAVSISGQRLSALNPVLGLGLPEIGPYRASAQLTGSAPHYRFSRLTGQIGLSDLAGELAVTTGGPRLRLDGRLHAHLLNRVDLVGGAPATWVEAADGRVFSARPLPFPDLQVVDGRVELSIDRLATWPLDLTEVESTVTLEDGQLTMQPLRASVAGGRLDLSVEADASSQPPTFRIGGHADRLDAEQLLPALGMTLSPTGPLWVDMDLAGNGATVRDILAHANGRARLTIGQGTLPVRHFDLIASDLLQAIMPWAIRRGDRTELNCLVGRFSIRNGLASANRLLIDTSRITVTGQGTIDLGHEQLDLKLDPRPKDPSLISLATRMRITGRLTDYTAAPDAMGLAKSAAAGLALAVGEINPLALFLPFISIGTGIANPCEGEVPERGQPLHPAVLAPLHAALDRLRGLFTSLAHSAHGAHPPKPEDQTQP